MRYSKFLGLLVVVLTLLAGPVSPLSAQGPVVETVSPAGEVVAKEAYNIGFVVKTLDNPYWVSLDAFGKETGEKLGVTLAAYSVGGESQIANEISIMEDIIAQGVDAIVLAPVDSKGIIPAVQDANAAGIPVLTVDTASDGGEIATFIATDNVRGAELAGEFTVDVLGGKGKVAILEGITGQQTGRDRLAGFHNIVDKYPDIQVVASQPGNWEKALGLTVAENVLTANPELDLIYACNDQMALGAVEAAKAAGRKVLIVGFDGVQEALEAVKAGDMAATVKQYPEKMGVLGIAQAVLLLNGQDIPARIDTGTALISADNVEEFLAQQPAVADLMKEAVIKKTIDLTPKEAYNIGFVVKTLDNPYWVSLDAFGKETGEKLGVTLAAYSVGGESQIANEISIMEDIIAQGVDAIVLAPVDSKGIIPAVQDANAAGIPVLTVDTASDGGEIATFIATDNVRGAELAGEFTVDVLGGKGKVAILEGITGQQTGRDRLAGFHNIVDKYPDIQVVASQPGNWEKALGLTVAENVLTANPELDLIYACNDQMALGAVEAAKAAGRKVLIVGFDGVQEALEAVKAGDMAATVKQYPEKMGVLGIAQAVLLLNGQDIPARIDTGTALISADNVEEFLAQQPTVDSLLQFVEVK